MRGMLMFLGAIIVMGLGFWSYQENYKTRDAIAEVRQLHRDIGAAHERLSRLRAEWAYLNRPDRLRDLAELNYERLGLLPLTPEAYGDVNQVIYPLPEIQPITNPIDVRSFQPAQGEENPL
ncbi:MAG: cell division protein FtsL [Pseudomonadota bacterium]